MADLLQATKAGAFIFFLMTIAWVAITNRYIRALSKNHPTSMIAMVFDCFDKQVERIVFKDAIASAAASAKTTSILTLSPIEVTAASVDSVVTGKSSFSVVNAIYICVAPKANVSQKVLLAMNSVLHLLVAMTLWSAGMIMSFVALSSFVPPDILAPIWAVILFGGSSWYLYSTMFRPILRRSAESAKNAAIVGTAGDLARMPDAPRLGRPGRISSGIDPKAVNRNSLRENSLAEQCARLVRFSESEPRRSDHSPRIFHRLEHRPNFLFRINAKRSKSVEEPKPATGVSPEGFPVFGEVPIFP